jgi:hypothetical protein
VTNEEKVEQIYKFLDNEYLVLFLLIIFIFVINIIILPNRYSAFISLLS